MGSTNYKTCSNDFLFLSSQKAVVRTDISGYFPVKCGLKRFVTIYGVIGEKAVVACKINNPK